MELRGYILIADITGYTSHLNESGLDLARETLGNLLELLIGDTKPALVSLSTWAPSWIDSDRSQLQTVPVRFKSWMLVVR